MSTDSRTGKDARRSTYLNLAGALAAGLIPVISLYSTNPETRFAQVVICLVVMSLLTAIVFIVLSLFTKDRSKAAIGTVLYFALMFSYGPLVNDSTAVAGPAITKPNFWFALGYNVLVLAYAVALISLRRSRRNVSPLSHTLSIAALSILCVATAQSFWNVRASFSDSLSTSQGTPVPIASEGTSPDIYFIVLDGYGRADALEALYKHDNSAFVEGLRQRGFFVADQGRANYLQTHLSLSSTLNFCYLGESSETTDTAYRLRLSKTMIRRNAVVDYLRGRGYFVISIASGFQVTDWSSNADVQLEANGLRFGEFELALLSLTPFSELTSAGNSLAAHGVRTRVLSQFEYLATSPTYPRPKFVFAHIVSPHPPFVFTAQGDPSTVDVPPTFADASHYLGSREQYRTGYVDQLQFVNSKVLQSIDAILAQYSDDNLPVIILQGDHGGGLTYDHQHASTSSLWDRSSILNAYLLPKDRTFAVYNSITPVNTFRVVFNGLFDENFPLLPDHTYFATWNKPFKHVEVQENELVPRL